MARARTAALISAAADSSWLTVRLAMQMSAPASASEMAIALPRPRLPPVTMTTLRGGPSSRSFSRTMGFLPGDWCAAAIIRAPAVVRSGHAEGANDQGQRRDGEPVKDERHQRPGPQVPQQEVDHREAHGR